MQRVWLLRVGTYYTPQSILTCLHLTGLSIDHRHLRPCTAAAAAAIREVFGKNGAYKTFARTGKFIEHDGENIADGEANAEDLVRNLQ